jgi:CRISPR/Cas system-associated protein Csm6
MAQVVLSLEEKYDKKLRKLAHELYDGRKGSMSQVVEEGINLVEMENKRKGAFIKMLSEVKNAKKLGIGRFKRAEAYE